MEPMRIEAPAEALVPDQPPVVDLEKEPSRPAEQAGEKRARSEDDEVDETPLVKWISVRL